MGSNLDTALPCSKKSNKFGLIWPYRADAVEAVRQDVDEKAADELVRAERHDFVSAIRPSARYPCT